jgi:homoserine kinase
MFARAPGSSANLGPGFDVLGLALGVWADVGLVPEASSVLPAGCSVADDHHPAAIAFRRAGGEGQIWTRTAIPMGRGLGYSGAVRVAGAALANAHTSGSQPSPITDDVRRQIFALGTSLEGHPDNVAASVYGGLVAATADRSVSVPIGMPMRIVAWVPTTTTSTDSSRRALPTSVSRDDAVFNIGHTAQFVAAIAAGDWDALRASVYDRLGQRYRLADVPRSAAAMSAFRDAGAAAWLSGSGPTVVAACPPDHVDVLLAGAPDDGHTKVLDVDIAGVVMIAE